MNRKKYIEPEVVANEVYTFSNVALQVVISNGTIVEEDATKLRKDEFDKNVTWGNLW